VAVKRETAVCLGQENGKYTVFYREKYWLRWSPWYRVVSPVHENGGRFVQWRKSTAEQIADQILANGAIFVKKQFTYSDIKWDGCRMCVPITSKDSEIDYGD